MTVHRIAAEPVWAIEVPGSLSDEARRNIGEAFKREFPDQRVIVLEEGLKVRTLAPLDATIADIEDALPTGSQWQAERGRDGTYQVTIPSRSGEPIHCTGLTLLDALTIALREARRGWT